MMPIRSCSSIAIKALTMPTSTASTTISRTRGPTEKSPRCLGISGTAALTESRISANEESPDHYWRAKLPQGAIEFRFRCRSEEHTSELQSLMRISYAVFCLKQKSNSYQNHTHHNYSPQQTKRTPYIDIKKKNTTIKLPN